MDEREKQLRKWLKGARLQATRIQREYKHLRENPEYEAMLMVDDRYYRRFAKIIHNILHPLTEAFPEEVTEKTRQEEVLHLSQLTVGEYTEILKKAYSPTGVMYRRLELLQSMIEFDERILVEEFGKAPPKWQRPEWLVRMEKGEDLWKPLERGTNG